jgi:hypothetical protein
MSTNRSHCLNILQKYSGCKVELITPNNISNYILEQYPIHPSYEYLSLTHKSDYMRAYLMYHFGGGYSDIKCNMFNWQKYFDKLLLSENKDFIGYAEQHPAQIASNNILIKSKYNLLAGMCHFICKAKSPIAQQWIQNLHNILDQYLYKLKLYPGHYHPRAVCGGVHGDESDKFKDSQYPLHWNEILGSILHPIMYQYIDRLLLDMPPSNVATGYR